MKVGITMAKNDDFELDFDFEKEYGISSEDTLELEYDEDEDFDTDLLSDIPMAVKQKPASESVQPPVAPVAEPEDDADFLDEFNALLAEPEQNEQLQDEALTYNEFDGIEEPVVPVAPPKPRKRSEEHTSELQSPM